jgi:hypothetical protein
VLSMSSYDVLQYAAIVLGVQVLAAGGVLVLGLRARSAFTPATAR